MACEHYPRPEQNTPRTYVYEYRGYFITVYSESYDSDAYVTIFKKGWDKEVEIDGTKQDAENIIDEWIDEAECNDPYG